MKNKISLLHGFLAAVSPAPGASFLDIGAREGWAGRIAMEHGLKATSIDRNESAAPGIITGCADFEDTALYREYDIVWCSHCLEHTLNPGNFLLAIRRAAKSGGYLAIIVPPSSGNIASRHFAVFNSGRLVYLLVMAGFDCSRAVIRRNGYNIGVFLRVNKIPRPPIDSDIEDIARWMPPGCDHSQFDGNIGTLGEWEQLADG